ncbi:unnamed protein product [Pedinophyceae sp. YPF-701]|nr:unnamed protein product [Pedinophyceae sp. YPF-701]
MTDVASILDNLNLSDSEASQLADAFKKEEFRKEFATYMESMSDPEYKKEQDEYLRQLEMQNRIAEVYGKDVQLIEPKPMFVAKTKDAKSKQKVFINMTENDKVDPPSCKNRCWSTPLRLGPKREGEDKQGAKCVVVDFVAHPQAYQLSARSKAFQNMIVEAAMDEIDKNYDTALERKGWTIPKMQYKGSEGMETPRPLAVRGAGGADGSAPGQRVKPVAGSNPEEAALRAEAEAGERAAAEGGKASEFGFKKAVEAKKPAPRQGEAGWRWPGGEVVPVHRVKQQVRGMDAGAAWGDSRVHRDPGRPTHIEVEVALPGCQASTIDVHHETRFLRVTAAAPPQGGAPAKLELSLPYPVHDDESRSRARWIRDRSTLQLTFEVLPAPATTTAQDVYEGAGGAALVEELPGGDDAPAEDEAAANGAEATDEPPQDASASNGDVTAPSENAAAAPAAPLAAEEPQDAEEETLTENQRRWKELHEQREAEARAKAMAEARAADEAAAAARQAAGGADVAPEGAAEFVPEPSGTFQGPRGGYDFKLGPSGLGYYLRRSVQEQEAAAAPAAVEQPAATGVRLAPRMNLDAVIDELD